MSGSKKKIGGQRASSNGWFMGNGWLALIISVFWFVVMYNHTSAPFVEFTPKSLWDLDRLSWGSNFLFCGAFFVAFVHTFITRAEQSKTERVLFLVSMSLMLISSIMVWRWGMLYDAPFFGVHMK